MALPVSEAYSEQQSADVNSPVAQVELLLGNYASSAGFGSTVTSSGADGSGNYPASGAIDSDRTEINIGAASSADNGIGKSSWRSSGIPDHGDTVTLTINFNASRTINRIKLYQMDGHGIKTYRLSWWNGIAWVVFAATSDISAAGQVSITTVFQLDVINFPDITTTQIMLTVLATQVANDPANVIELEVYRLIDITDRVKGIQTAKQRDYKLQNPMAMSVRLTCNNNDRFFSVSHVPTAEEVAEGFVNQDLGPEVGVIVSMGFNIADGGEQVATLFTGTIDNIGIKPLTREATIECRDGIKTLINRVDGTKLKTSQDIGTNIQYLLNRANISDYEMSIDTSPITLDYFFVDQVNPLSVIRDLVQAGGDSVFYFDETGNAIYKFFATTVPLSHSYTSEADFEAGTLDNISTKDGTNSLKVPILFAPTLVSGALTGNASIGGGGLTVSVADTVFTPALTSFTNITTATKVAAPWLPTFDATIKSVVLPVLTISSPGFIVENVVIWADSGGSPGSVLYTGPNGSTSVSPNLFVASGTQVWIGVMVDAASSITAATWVRRSIGGPANWITGQGKSFVAGSWVNTFDTTDAQNVSLAVRMTMNGSASPITGTWTSGIYDSFSIAIGGNMTFAIVGSFPAGTSGSITIYGSADGVTFDVNYAQANPNGTYTVAVANRRYWYVVISLTVNSGIITLPTTQSPSLYFGASGTWISPSLNMGATVTQLDALGFSQSLNSGSVVYYTRTSNDGTTWDVWVLVPVSGQISSALRRYIQVRSDIFLSSDFTRTPEVLDITVNWQSGSGSPKYPTVVSFVFSFDSTMLDIEQQLADNLSGDSEIINDATVQAQPILLTGANTDTVWQGTIGSPPTAISVSTPLDVIVGTYVYSPYIAGGMDISRMSGANPAAAVITFAGGAVGSWVFSYIHPTLPVLTITITSPGQITDLRITGKVFTNASYLLAQRVTDAQSISLYGSRQISISNQWIVGVATALSIATEIIANFKDAIAYLPSCNLRPTFSCQVGDRVTVIDDNTDLDGDYIVVGINHKMAVNMDQADAGTDVVLVSIPEGS